MLKVVWYAASLVLRSRAWSLLAGLGGHSGMEVERKTYNVPVMYPPQCLHSLAVQF